IPDVGYPPQAPPAASAAMHAARRAGQAMRWGSARALEFSPVGAANRAWRVDCHLRAQGNPFLAGERPCEPSSVRPWVARSRGWTLGVGGFVFRDLKNTTTTTDDTFRLVLGGASHDLVLIDSAQNIYHTKDEIFVRIQYVAASDYWILTTKDGTQHRFGYNAD